MKIALGCDHGGLNLKDEVAKYLKSQNIEFKDFGTYTEESCDYADISLPVAEAVVAKEFDFGILICGTGIGIGIAANKVPGIRAALCSDTFSAHATREHNILFYIFNYGNLSFHKELPSFYKFLLSILIIIY